MKRPLTQAEHKRLEEDNVSREYIVEERLWNKRPDGIGQKRPTQTKSGSFIILEFKSMSDVTKQYIVRARQTAEEQ